MHDGGHIDQTIHEKFDTEKKYLFELLLFSDVYMRVNILFQRNFSFRKCFNKYLFIHSFLKYLYLIKLTPSLNLSERTKHL